MHADALDHVRIQRALRQEIGAAELGRLLVEHFDEHPADGLALQLRVRDPRQCSQEQRARVPVHERDVETVPERAHHLVAFAQPHQPAIHEDAGQLVPHRLMDQRRRDRAIDAAAQPADHPPLPHLRPHPLDLPGAKAFHAPPALEPGHAMRKIMQQLPAVRRVHHLRMKLHTIEAPCIVGDGGERGILGQRHRPEPRWQRRHPVPVVHPYEFAGTRRPGAVEQRAVLRHIDGGGAVFLVIAEADGPAQLRHHGLLAVTDAQHRHPRRPHRVRHARPFGVHDAGRAAGEDESARTEREQAVGGHGSGHNFAIHARFPHPPGNQLGKLAAEVENEYSVGRQGSIHGAVCRIRPRRARDSRP